MQHRLDAPRATGVDREARRRAGERAAAHDAAVHDHERPVVEHQGNVAPEVRGDAPGRGVPAARHQDHPGASRERSLDRAPRAGGDRLVAAKQGPVDVEGDETDAAGGRGTDPHSPVQTSTRSITSPGRMRSTASMPATTWPNRVKPPSSCGWGARVMKNWLPPVSLPERAMPTAPRP